MIKKILSLNFPDAPAREPREFDPIDGRYVAEINAGGMWFTDLPRNALPMTTAHAAVWLETIRQFHPNLRAQIVEIVFRGGEFLYSKPYENN